MSAPQFDFKIHGIMMWIIWSLLSLVLFASNRYLKGTLYGKNMWIHRIIGTVMMFITLMSGFFAWRKLGFKILPNSHSYFGFPVFFGVPLIAIGGIISRSCLRRSVWNTARALQIKRGHQIFGFCLVLVGQAAVATGIYNYRTNSNHQFDQPLEWISIV